ncbi:aminoglycoside phosphotransferase family protein [Umezawaea sp.]|uniref:phosphotransferase enzyme family protein n=1 Tax=Umezawaea sp. TaxID=1955258 RepID=UPI002ED10C67
MSSTVTLDGRFTREKLADALRRLCAEHGLDHRGARLLKFTSNAVFELPAERAVVRIVGSTRLRHRAAKVVRVAAWLAEHDVPAVRLLPGFPSPVVVGDHLATLWQHVPGPVQPGRALDGRDLARVLRRLHELPAPPFELPEWAPLDDVRRRLADAEELSDPDRSFLQERCASLAERLSGLRPVLPRGVLHGDAHLGNLIASRSGPVLCDFDSTSTGPREWDLSSLPVGVARFGHSPRWQRQLVRGYRFDVTRWDGFPVLRDLRELKLTTSALPILRSHPGARSELRRRLTSLRRGDTAARWSPYR